ncbi:MAG: hypothetical protein IT542_08630 [Rubellimicrobium sp.]|nr:hypothetical protein [Rubellimicrobium sp.]
MSRSIPRTTVAVFVLALGLGGCSSMFPYLDTGRGSPALAAAQGGQSAVLPAAQPVAPAAALAPVDRLVAAIEANGCLLNAQNADAIQSAAGLSRGEVAGHVQELRAAGRVEAAASGTIRLLSANCI